MLLLCLLGMHFDAAVVFFNISSLLFKMAMAMLWRTTYLYHSEKNTFMFIQSLFAREWFVTNFTRKRFYFRVNVVIMFFHCFAWNKSFITITTLYQFALFMNLHNMTSDFMVGFKIFLALYTLARKYSFNLFCHKVICFNVFNQICMCSRLSQYRQTHASSLFFFGSR